MSASNTDRRVVRSRSSLAKALIELLVEMGYENVTVQHIIDRAGVGRSTFYSHYRDKEDLLRASIKNLRDALERHWLSSLDAQSIQKGKLGFALPFLNHVDGKRDIWDAIVGCESGQIVDRHFRRMLADLTRLDLGSDPNRPSEEIRVQFVVGALMSIVSWWLDFDAALAPAEVNRLFLELALPGLSVSLAGPTPLN
jgi:AcrR family transcriptional regulator